MTFFNPKINNKSKTLKRNLFNLQKDAQRRQRAKEELQEIMSEKASLEANKAYINSKSDKVLYDKFCKDFNNVCYNNDINPNNEQTKITCTQMSGLFL